MSRKRKPKEGAEPIIIPGTMRPTDEAGRQRMIYDAIKIQIDRNMSVFNSRFSKTPTNEDYKATFGVCQRTIMRHYDDPSTMGLKDVLVHEAFARRAGIPDYVEEAYRAISA